MNSQLNYESANWGDLDYWTMNNTGAKFPNPGAASTTFAKIDNYDPERGGASSFPLAKQVVFGVNIQF